MIKKRYWTGIFILIIIPILTASCTDIGNPVPTLIDRPAPQSQNPIPEPGNSEDFNVDVVPRQSENARKLDVQEPQKDIFVIQPECSVIPGWDASFIVTFHGNPVSDVMVLVNFSEIGKTDETGKISFSVPYTQEIKIEAVKNDVKGELVINLDEELGG